MAGYSATALVGKLGIKDGGRLGLLGAPDGFVGTLEGLPGTVRVTTRAAGPLDVIVTFHTRRSHLEQRVPALLAALDVDGGLWVAWPKRASKVPTDISEGTVREVFLPLGLVDNKVCAIDETWSGLRVVWRREERAGRRALKAPRRGAGSAGARDPR